MTCRLLHYADLENAYDDPERIARLAGLIEERRDADTLVVGSGDDLAVGVLATVTNNGPKQALPFFRAAEPDADTFGNHDFGAGPSAVLDAVRSTSQEWLCANVTREGNATTDGRRFGADEGVAPTACFHVGGSRVGVFGIAHPETGTLAPAAADLTFGDPIAAARRAVDALHERGVEHVVGLSHLGDDEELARAVDADAVLGGHRHSRRIERIDGTLVVRSAGNGDDLMEVQIGDTATVDRHDVADGVPDADVHRIYRGKVQRAGLDEVLATVAEPIHRTYETRFHGESRVGNFVADAYRWGTDADLGVAAGGSIRLGDPLDGEVTVKGVIGTVPFENRLVVASLTGTDLRSLFAEAEGGGPDDDPPWWHLHVSGARIVWDHAAREVIELVVGGEPVDPTATYRIAVSEFLCDLDSFPTLTAEDITERFDDQYTYPVRYARRRGIATRTERRIVRRNLPE